MLALLAVAAVIGLWFFTRTRQLFYVSVRDGHAILVHGRVPPTLLGDMKRILAKPPVARGWVKALKTERGGRLVFSGIDEGRQQRLRNIFAFSTLSQLRNSPMIERPTICQLLGIAWLARLLER